MRQPSNPAPSTTPYANNFIAASFAACITITLASAHAGPTGNPTTHTQIYEKPVLIYVYDSR